VTLARWQWIGGGDAALISLNGDHASLDSSRPSPPGSTLEGRCGDIGSVSVKVKSCRRVDERFRIDGRLLYMTREQRRALVQSD
jgi:hypothetical protein